MKFLGKYKPGSTIFVPFDTFDSAGASVTMTGLAVTDIEIFKNGNVAERASDAGYTLLDTDGIDFDGRPGLHGFSIDTSDDTAAGFFVAGATYFIAVDAVTIDGNTVRFWAAMFYLGYEGAILDTTIASLTSQTQFTLTDGPADNGALDGCPVIVHDKASGVQIAQGIVSSYTGGTKTINLVSDPGVFTMATGDNISIFPKSPYYMPAAEPTGVPAATAAPVTKDGYLYRMARNRIDVDKSTSKKTYYQDGGTADFEKDLSDDGTTYTETKANAVA